MKTERKFIRNTSSKSSSFIRIKRPALVIPALLTKISIAPNDSIIFLKVDSTISEEETSQAYDTTLTLNSASNEEANSLFSFVAIIAILAPREAKTRAISNPIPREEIGRAHV